VHVRAHVHVFWRIVDQAYAYVCVCVLENTTTEPHAHDISADIMRVRLSGYILQQCACYLCMAD
jgi:hypothetical protein